MKYFWKLYYLFKKTKTKSDTVKRHARINGYKITDLGLSDDPKVKPYWYDAYNKPISFIDEYRPISKKLNEDLLKIIYNKMKGNFK